MVFGLDDKQTYLERAVSCLIRPIREHLMKKKCFLSGIARMRGGEGLARIKKYTLYIPL